MTRYRINRQDCELSERVDWTQHHLDANRESDEREAREQAVISGGQGRDGGDSLQAAEGIGFCVALVIVAIGLFLVGVFIGRYL